MSLERIFSELKSRKFQFVVDGMKYELPHLNTMKVELYELNEKYSKDKELSEIEVMFSLFSSAGGAFSKKYKSMKMRDIKKVFQAWCRWSGFNLEKVFGLGK